MDRMLEVRSSMCHHLIVGIAAIGHPSLAIVRIVTPSFFPFHNVGAYELGRTMYSPGVTEVPSFCICRATCHDEIGRVGQTHPLFN
jgi:hypothetical protein